jgi:beta-1,2-mannobiose phosphorylase / 1,2-beta-oligomannan phosphorylase
MLNETTSGLCVHSILSVPPVSLDRLHEGRPVLEPVLAHTWERRVVLNPAAALVQCPDELEFLFSSWGLDESQRNRLRTAGGACVLLYRAQGDADPDTLIAPSCLGMAVCTPDLELVYRRNTPVLEPREPFHNLGIEDPRCTRVGDTYFLHYTGYFSDESHESTAEGRTCICLATSSDFVTWEIHGPVPGDVNDVRNKNATLFPVPVHDTWTLMHRPMEGADAMAIHLAEAESPYGPWKSTGVVMRSCSYCEFEQSWVGAGGPPVDLGDDRFLVIYHVGHRAADGAREYDLAAALVDFNTTPIVRARIEPLLRPTQSYERVGDPDLGVDNVLFTCGNYLWGEFLIIPYAGADSRIFGASVSLDDLVLGLESLSSD